MPANSPKKKTATTYNFTVVYERQSDGSYVISVPALPGCHSEGRTFEEAQEMIADAIRGYIVSLQKHGEPIPADIFKHQFVGNVQISVNATV